MTERGPGFHLNPRRTQSVAWILAKAPPLTEGPLVFHTEWWDSEPGDLLQSFREELEGLIQEQMKKGNNSSNIWALRQIADFMASTSQAVFPTSSMSMWGSWGDAAQSLGGGGQRRKNSLVARLQVSAQAALARKRGAA